MRFARTGSSSCRGRARCDAPPAAALARVPILSNEAKEAVRHGADLVELVRGRVHLTRRGGRWWGRCPFHAERTPSFSLIPPDFTRYYCHGCGATGDVFDWMREQEGVASFREAVEALAERFDIPLAYEDESPDERRRRAEAERRRELLERAAGFYAELLWRSAEAAPAREYLQGRGFGEDVIRRFRIGWAPGGGAVLARRALDQGFARRDLVEAGLARERGAGLADFFARRIIFPISDARGRVQGFGARTLDPRERAKYVNSPEGAGFRKRELVYGLAEARAEASRERFFVVAEGYTDVLGLVAAGAVTAVACMGTSLTTAQLRLLRRWAPEARLCFDADAAGEGAAWRTVEAAREVPSLRLAAVRLPPGRDPGDLAASPEGRESLLRAVREPEALVGSLIRSRITRAGASAQEREAARADVVELLRGLPDSVEKDEGVRLAAGLLRLSRGAEEQLHEEARRRESAAPAPVPAGVLSAQEARERRFLALAAAMPREARPYVEGMPRAAFEDAGHARGLDLLRAGTPLHAWPAELAGLAAALRVEAAGADAGAGAAPLREAAYRLELAAVERRAAELRDGGDAEGRMAALALAQRIREALRGEVEGAR